MSYGCHGRPPYKMEQVLHGMDSQTGFYIKTVVPFRNSPDCEYTHSNLGQKDPGCWGCCHRKPKEESHV